MEGWLAEMSWRQFQEWQSYAEIEPFGEERADLRAGIVASSIVNAIVNVSPHVKRKSRSKPSDFMPQFKREKQKTMDADAFALMKSRALTYASTR